MAADLANIDFYHHRLSPFAMVSKVVLLNYNINHTEHEVDLSSGQHKQAWYLKINPDGTIPSIKDDDYCLSESIAQSRYLCERSKIESKFYPFHDAKLMAIQNMWLDFAGGKFRYKTMTCYFQIFIGPTFFNTPMHSIEMQNKFVDDVKIVYKEFDKKIEKAGTDYLTGDEISLADVYLAIMVLTLVDSSIMTLHEYPFIQAWFERVAQNEHIAYVRRRRRNLMKLAVIFMKYLRPVIKCLMGI